MKALAIGAAVALLLGAATDASAAGSKLFGHWRLAKGDCAQRAFVFMDRKETVDENYPGFPPGQSSYPVSYNDVNPKETYVIGTGGETGFKFLSANRVLMDTSNFCEYVRP